MDLTHRFTVPAPIDEAWAAFNDLERIAPCFPGASLTSYDGEEFAGLVKVKLGPISLQYTGTGRFLERDEEARKAVIEAKGKDKRGNGTAAASITAQLSEGVDGTTDVEVVTALNVTGKPAQFGRGVMQDVSDKLLGQFATCLETRLGPAAAEPSPEPGPSPEPELSGRFVPEDDEPAPEPVGVDPAPEAEPTPPTRPAAEREQPEQAALNLGTTVLPILLKRYAPYLVAGLVGLVILWKLLRRRH